MNEEMYREMEKDNLAYKLTGDAMGIAYWTAKVEKNAILEPVDVVEWSQSFRDMIGYTDEKDFPNLLSSWMDIVHPDDREYAAKALLNHLHDTTGQTPFDIEHRLMTKSGEYRYFRAVGTTQRDAEGHPIRSAGAAQDITKERQMREEIELRDKLLNASNTAATLLLTSGEKPFEVALHKSMGVIAEAMDVDRVYVWKNHIVDGQLRCGQVHEWSETAEVQQGKDFAISIPYAAISQWEEALSAGTCVNSVVRDLPQEARNFLEPKGIVSTLVVPVFLQDKFWGFVGFDDCRRERVFTKTEESILSSTSLLLANAWTREEAYRELEEERITSEAERIKAESANKAKTDFLARMSHELRTPMNAVIGMAELGLKAAVDGRKDYALQQIITAGKHLNGVVNNILDLSEIEEGKMELKLGPFDMNELLEEVKVVVGPLAKNKNHRLEVSTSDESFPPLIGDAARVRQILVNIIGNSIKFTHAGGMIKLRTDLVKREEGVCHLKISIKDTGIGITPEDLKTLFEPFAKFGESTSQEHGSGLGLPITKHFIEMMGSEIKVDSEKGMGTEFTFTIPFQEALNLELKQPEEQDVAGMRDFKGHTIMLVDDVDTNLIIGEAMLEDTNIEVHGVDSAKRAINMFQERPERYDLIFMDVQMPDMDGLECTRRIRAMNIPWAKKIPIIALSANAFKDDIEKSLAAGMNEHFMKPFEREVIVGALHKYIPVKESVRDQKAAVENAGKGADGVIEADAIKKLVPM